MLLPCLWWIKDLYVNSLTGCSNGLSIDVSIAWTISVRLTYTYTTDHDHSSSHYHVTKFRRLKWSHLTCTNVSFSDPSIIRRSTLVNSGIRPKSRQKISPIGPMVSAGLSVRLSVMFVHRAQMAEDIDTISFAYDSLMSLPNGIQI